MPLRSADGSLQLPAGWSPGRSRLEHLASGDSVYLSSGQLHWSHQLALPTSALKAAPVLIIYGHLHCLL